MDKGVTNMAIYLVLIVAITFCTLTVVLCRRYVQKTYNSIDTVLDYILSGKHPQPSKLTIESRLSKLTHKAYRIMNMCTFEITQTKEEKETIQSFISDMSHQMKTPLSGISMYTELLLEENLSAHEQREFLYRIKSSAEKLQWIMESLIKVSRLEVGAIQLSPTSEDIKQTIMDAIGSVIPAATKKNIHISANFQSLSLYHDQKWTREAIVNVLDNAIKYSEVGGIIKVTLEQMPLYTKVIIMDNGIGIRKSDWNLIFKRFYRGINVNENEGSGLGLYLAELIMKKQGGYIMVDSVYGEFTSFSLFFQNGGIE